MTMNTRQAGAFTELIKKEEAARERWQATYGQTYGNGSQTQRRPSTAGAATQRGPGPNGAVPINANARSSFPTSFGGTTARPLSARPVDGAGYGNGQPAPQAGFTASGRPHQVFANAVAVGTPRLVDQNDKDFVKPQTVTKKIIRQVEVPTTRQVKVPIKTKQIVTEMVPRQIRTKKLVEEDGLTEREEEYDEIELIPSTRQREVMVPKLITEPYQREVVVKRVRKIKVPVKRFVEKEEWATVEVPEQRTIEVDGVRVDEVKETKIVEVEEYHTYQLKPVPTGEAEVIRTKDIGTGRRLSGRLTGRDLFHASDPALAHLSNDSSAPRQPQGQPRYGGAPLQRPSSAAPYSARYQPQSGVSSDSRRLGFKVRTSSTSPGTCSVFDVEPGQLAHRSGLKPNDIILSANGRQTNTLQDFKNAIGTSKGPLLLQVKRGADRLVITLQR